MLGYGLRPNPTYVLGLAYRAAAVTIPHRYG